MYPDLAGRALRVLTGGWGSIAVDVDNAWIFKFPRDVAIADGLLAEAELLQILRPLVSLEIPHLEVKNGFSRHAKLAGDVLTTSDYEKLPLPARERLADAVAGFLAELHAIDSVRIPNTRRVAALLPIDVIRQRVWPLLPTELRRYAERTITAWRHASTDPYGLVFGYFDAHGANMAFDHATQTLRGIYDFGDTGIGPLHHEFIHPSWVSADLAERVINAYERITTKQLDRERIAMLTGIMRLSKLAEYAGDSSRVEAMRWAVAEWAARG